MKPEVFVTRPLLPEAMAYLEKHVDITLGTRSGELTKPQIAAGAGGKQGLVALLVDEIDRDIMDAAPGLRIIANCAVGYNNIDVDSARSKGIMVTNTPGVLTDTTADLTWALILATARRIPEADRFTRAGRFSGWELDLMLGKEITGKRLGIIGMGRIGREVAARAAAFRMEVIYHDPHPLSPEEEMKLHASHVPLRALLESADVISLHTTLTEKSRHLIGMDELTAMKRDAILINVSRGPVVDEKALARALEDKEIWGAGLDVFEREPDVEERLMQLENAVIVPHIGSATYETRLRMSMMAATNLVQGLSGETPDNLV